MCQCVFINHENHFVHDAIAQDLTKPFNFNERIVAQPRVHRLGLRCSIGRTHHAHEAVPPFVSFLQRFGDLGRLVVGADDQRLVLAIKNVGELADSRLGIDSKRTEE